MTIENLSVVYLQSKWKKKILDGCIFLMIAFTSFSFFACDSTPIHQEQETPPKIVAHSISDSTSRKFLTKTQSIKIDYDSTKWMEVSQLIPSIVLDMRYATTNNFVKEKLYDCERCFLRPEVAMALAKVQAALQKKGLGLKMFDCFRPRLVQQKLWDIVPNASYVTPPTKGSMHNRGLAVDVTLVDQHGKELNMGTGFDFFGKEAHQDYTNLPKEVLDNRKRLKESLQQFGFKAIRTEWWHYFYPAKKYELSDMLWSCQH